KVLGPVHFTSTSSMLHSRTMIPAATPETDHASTPSNFLRIAGRFAANPKQIRIIKTRETMSITRQVSRRKWNSKNGLKRTASAPGNAPKARKSAAQSQSSLGSYVMRKIAITEQKKTLKQTQRNAV